MELAVQVVVVVVVVVVVAVAVVVVDLTFSRRPNPVRGHETGSNTTLQWEKHLWKNEARIMHIIPSAVRAARVSSSHCVDVWVRLTQCDILPQQPGVARCDRRCSLHSFSTYFPLYSYS